MTDQDLTPGEQQRLRAQVARLPEEIEPTHDLWPAIRGRIEAARVTALPTAAPLGPANAEEAAAGRPGERRRMPWGRLAAAAVALVILSVSLTWLAVVPDEPRMPMIPSIAGSPADVSGATTPTTLAMFASYERSAADLASTLEQRSARLDPATRAVLERSLRTIDAAIAEARTALAADPASAAYQSFVEAAYRQKIDFLRRANDVAALQGP